MPLSPLARRGLVVSPATSENGLLERAAPGLARLLWLLWLVRLVRLVRPGVRAWFVCRARRARCVRLAVLALEALLPPGGVTRLLGIDIRLPRIAMLSPGPPVWATLRLASIARCRSPSHAPAGLAHPPGTRAAGRLLALAIGPRLLWRAPEPASREPLHHGIWMLLAQPMKRGEQVVAVRRAEGRRQSASNDGPVCESRGHITLPVA
jgi:hypothetical protein